MGYGLLLQNDRASSYYLIEQQFKTIIQWASLVSWLQNLNVVLTRCRVLRKGLDWLNCRCRRSWRASAYRKDIATHRCYFLRNQHYYLDHFIFLWCHLRCEIKCISDATRRDIFDRWISIQDSGRCPFIRLSPRADSPSQAVWVRGLAWVSFWPARSLLAVWGQSDSCWQQRWGASRMPFPSMSIDTH